jgi:hypothetical protein
MDEKELGTATYTMDMKETKIWINFNHFKYKFMYLGINKDLYIYIMEMKTIPIFKKYNNYKVTRCFPMPTLLFNN